MDQGVPELVVEVMHNPVNGAGADEEAPAPPEAQKYREMWVADINEQLMKCTVCRNATKLRRSTAENNSKIIEPSIFCTGVPPKKFYVGYLLRDGWKLATGGHRYMWEYVAFMTNWLGLDVNRWLELMQEKEGEVRDYYEEQFQLDLVKESKLFLESLLIGSCFLCFSIILLHNVKEGTEILKGTGRKKSTGESSSSEKENGTTESADPCRYEQFYTLHRVIMKDQMETKLDMLNLENQIPWFAVETVFESSKLSDLTSGSGSTTMDLAILCFDNLYPQPDQLKLDNDSTSDYPSGGFKHLLHIFYWTRTPYDRRNMKLKFAYIPFAGFNIPNATELLESATVLKKSYRVCSAEYHSQIISGGLHITPLHIYPYTNEIYRDLLYFEQKYSECRLDFTVHFAFFKSLIQTKADVTILEKSGILKNTMAGDIDVLYFVNSTGRLLENKLNACIPLRLIYLTDKVTKHHRRRFGKEYAKFKRLFFPSRWVLVSILAGITLAVLTIIQTVYTVLGYYKA